jgi:hypothetical protein
MARDYKKEYANYQGKPEQIARRSKRNTARRTLEKEGLVSKGDGNDVNHRVAIVKGGQNIILSAFYYCYPVIGRRRKTK